MEEHPPSTTAASRRLPQTSFYSIEYPGYVSETPEALSGALKTLGGQASVDKIFKQPRSRVLDLKLRPDDLFAHPIPGEAVNSLKILVQVTRRKRRKRDPEVPPNEPTSNQPEPHGESDAGMEVDAGQEIPTTPSSKENPNPNPWEEEPMYTTELLGTIPRTVRFRAMADFQYTPNLNDPIIKLRQSMDALDMSTVEAIKSFVFPVEEEDYTLPLDAPLTPEAMEDPTVPKTRSNLRIPHFPVFSRATIPLQYNYKANPFSTVQTIQDPETGEEKQRLINKTRFKGFGTLAIDFHDPGEVPSGPNDHMNSLIPTVSMDLLRRVREQFDIRPIWARVALLNQFSLTDRREIFHSKMIIPLVSYAFNDGPFRDMYIRFGYDPRKDPDARLYQRVTFRYTTPNYQRRRPVIESRNPSDIPKPHLFETSHIFDGKTAQNEVGPGFQLCDIHDPLLESLIKDDSDLRTECHERDGWYSAAAFDRIKAVTRRKLFGLIEENRIISDSEVADIMEKKTTLSKAPGGKKEPRLVAPDKEAKKRKRNRAKGAGPWEEETATRLKAALRRKKQAGEDEEERGESNVDADDEDASGGDSDYQP
ncbi:tau 95 subunit of transcription factor TFIIIC [Tulasnella sp. 424]|nr:tau 95 subunit of transcription factor TFIIIC [Tulasnella sp. 424]KAG8977720.1 tau 95 subunit of transcription factor TFIIIC [Tulasnella sp. 425]